MQLWQAARTGNHKQILSKWTLLYLLEQTEIAFQSENLPMKFELLLIDGVGMTVILSLAGIFQWQANSITDSVIYLIWMLLLNALNFFAWKQTGRFFNLCVFMQLILQQLVLQKQLMLNEIEAEGPRDSRGNDTTDQPGEHHPTMIPIEVIQFLLFSSIRILYLTFLTDTLWYRLASLLAWFPNSLELMIYFDVVNFNLPNAMLSMFFLLLLVALTYWNSMTQRVKYFQEQQSKDRMTFWMSFFQNDIEGIAFVASSYCAPLGLESSSRENVQSTSIQSPAIHVEFCNTAGMQEFQATKLHELESKVLNEVYVNVNNGDLMALKDFVQSILVSSNANYMTNVLGEQESTPLHCVYLDESTRSQKYFDMKLIACKWKKSPGMTVLLSKVSHTTVAARLQKNNQYNDYLLASVSHNLKTPLNAMIQISQSALVACASHSNNTFKKSLEMIEKNSRLLMSMVQDILDYNQIKIGALKLNQERVNVRRLIEEVYDLLKFQFEDKGIGFTIDVISDLIVTTDANRLRQVLNILVGNALKFTFKGNVKVSAYNSMRNNEDTIRFCVVDTGTGIDSLLQSRLFELYSTFNHKSKSDSNRYGAGFGLAICKQLVSLLGPIDNIELSSQEGTGSSFSFEIYANLDILGRNSCIIQSQRKSLLHPLSSKNVINQIAEKKRSTLTAKSLNFYSYLGPSSETNTQILGEVTPATPPATTTTVTQLKSRSPSTYKSIGSINILSPLAYTGGGINTNSNSYNNNNNNNNNYIYQNPSKGFLKDIIEKNSELLTCERIESEEYRNSNALCLSGRIELIQQQDYRNGKEDVSRKVQGSTLHENSMKEQDNAIVFESGDKFYSSVSSLSSFPTDFDNNITEFYREIDFNDVNCAVSNEYVFIEQKKSKVFESFLRKQLKRILIVDDTPFNIRALKIMVESIMGETQLEILQAFNGQQSLDVLDDCYRDGKTVDIVFMDINMPVMDGLEAARLIRQNPEYAQIKIAFASASSLKDDLWKRKQEWLYADAYLEKPISRAQLLKFFSNLAFQAFRKGTGTSVEAVNK